MCILACAWKAHPVYPFVLIGNRDEFYQRAATPAHWWEEKVHILAGKDVRGGGTWLGVNEFGSLAVLTNYRNPRDVDPQAPSRGKLVSSFLSQHTEVAEYTQQLSPFAKQYNGFNMLAKFQDELWYISNQSAQLAQRLEAGVYGLSNALLDTPWPKVQRLKAGFEQVLKKSTLDLNALFALLEDKEKAEDKHLPQTGVPLAWERKLSSIFIESPDYGTRVSTVVLIDQEGQVYFEERPHVPNGESARFEFHIQTPHRS